MPEEDLYFYGGWGAGVWGSTYSGAPTLPPGGEDAIIFSGTHAITSDNLTLTQKHYLTVHKATHGITSDSPTPVLDIALIVQDAIHGHTADNIQTSIKHLLEVQDASHALSSDDLSIIEQIVLSIQDSSHGITSDSLAFTQKHSLLVQDATHANTSDLSSITQKHTLVVQDGAITFVPNKAQVLIKFGTGTIGSGEYTPRTEPLANELVPATPVSVDQYTPQAVTPRTWEDGGGPDSGSWNSA